MLPPTCGPEMLRTQVLSGIWDARCPFENGSSPPPCELEHQVLAHTELPCLVSGHRGCKTQTSLAEAQVPPPDPAWGQQAAPSALGTTFSRSSHFQNKSQEQSWLQEGSVFSEKSIPKVRRTQAWLPYWSERGNGIINKETDVQISILDDVALENLRELAVCCRLAFRCWCNAISITQGPVTADRGAGPGICLPSQFLGGDAAAAWEIHALRATD